MGSFPVDGERAHALLRRLGPARLGGSPAEQAAAGVLMQEIRTLGLEPVEETFRVHSFSDARASLRVLAPYEAEVPCAAIGRSGSTDPAGLCAPLLFAESGGPAYLSGARGKIALIFGRLDARKYEALARAGAAAFVCIGMPQHTTPTLNMLEVRWLERWGAIPGAFVTFVDGLRLLQTGASEVCLTVSQNEFIADSRNVTVEVPGTVEPERVILIGAHFDSHRDMDGAHDNGAGTVVAMELLRHFAGRPARRTLRFVWFGSEEMGVCGSEAYVAAHAGELDRIRFMLNLDLGGGVIGQDAVDTMGPPELTAFFELLDKEQGLGLDIQEKVYGGDNIPLLEAGVPACTVYRSGGTCVYIHSSGDSFDLVDGHHLALLGEVAGSFLDRIANAYQFPFRREVPEAIQKKLKRMREDYFGT